MTKSASKSVEALTQAPFSSRIADEFEAVDLLHINNIQGGRLRDVFVVNVKNVDTIGQLKQTISGRNGLFVDMVYYRGVCLKDSRKLAHLLPDMLNMGPPRFSMRTSSLGVISVFVKALTGKKWQEQVAADGIVADLLAAIEQSQGYVPEGVRIVFAGKQLEANMSLAEYNLQSGSTVHVILRLFGGGGGRFVDMENTSALKILKVQPYQGHSEWTIVRDGLVVEGKCRDAGCEAFGKQVFCNKGFTVFNIAEDSRCPMCRNIFEATTCGFTGCQWMFEGRKAGSTSVDLMSKWNATLEGDYQYYDEDGGRNMTQWSSLIITTKELAVDKVTGKRTSKPDATKCAACFGTITPMVSANRSDNIASCGHSLHSDCAMALCREGYVSCPMCRDPMATPT